MPATLPHTFNDGPGNTASGVEVMDNFNAVNAGVFAATVTSLPSSPVNGQDCFYLADATNGIVWHLKYRSASASAYKWEFVGGGSLMSEVAAAESTGSTTYVALTTAGPSVTVPLAGDYLIVHGALITTGTGAGSTAFMSYDVGGAAASDNDSVQLSSTITGGDRVIATPQFERVKAGLVAATAIVPKYKSSVGTATFARRHLRVWPQRVG